MKTILCYERSSFEPARLLQNIALILLGVMLGGCEPKQAELEHVIIRGSNTIGEELAPQLVAAYKKDHPTVTFDLEFKGTAYGFGALMVDRCDIAGASREATKSELELAKDRAIEFNAYVIGAYSVAVVVNAASPVANLTTNQVRDIFSGAVQNWKDVGGPDAAIHVYVRDPVSGTHLGFQEVAMDKKPYASGMKTFTNYNSLAEAVVRDPHGIGYASIDLARKSGVKAVTIGGVAPTADTVNKGQYPYARVLRLFTNKAKEAPAARNFIEFAQSARGQEIVAQAGDVPHP